MEVGLYVEWKWIKVGPLVHDLLTLQRLRSVSRSRTYLRSWKSQVSQMEISGALVEKYFVLGGLIVLNICNNKVQYLMLDM